MQNVLRQRPGKLMEPLGKYTGFDIYHNVGYTTLWGLQKVWSVIEHPEMKMNRDSVYSGEQ
jgi:hypothetical protein